MAYTNPADGSGGAFIVAYRATVYAARSVDPTEATVLSPIAGAPHSDPFQVITLQNVTGWKPYLGAVKGRRGRLDPLTKNVDVGQFTFDVLDYRINVGKTDNATRWVAAFFGNAAGQNQLLSLKVLIEESLDGGATWASFFTGRITDVQLNGLLNWTFTLYDMSVDLNVPVFVGTPSSCVGSYAQVPSLLPVGLMKPYGIYPNPSALTGIVGQRGSVTINGTSFASGIVDFDQLIPTASPLAYTDSATRPDNFLTYQLAECAPILGYRDVGTYSHGYITWGHPDLAHVVMQTSSGATGEFRLGAMLTKQYNVQGFGTLWHITSLYLDELLPMSTSGATPLNFLSMPSTGSLVQCYIKRQADWVLPPGFVFDQPNVVINDIAPAQLYEDLLGGYYGYFYNTQNALPPGSTYGQPIRSVAMSTSGFAALLADPTYPPARFVVTQPDTLGPWIQTNLLQPYQLGYYFNGAGQLVPVDLRRPTTAPAITITDADRVEGQNPSYEYSTDSLVTNVYLNYYQDWPNGITIAVLQGGQWPTAPGTPYPLDAGFIQSLQFNAILVNFGRPDIGITDLTLDAPGYRFMSNEQVVPSSGGPAQDRGTYMLNKLTEFTYSLQQPFGSGATSYSLVCRRTSNTTPVWPGIYVNVAVSGLVDPSQNVRGGSRIGLCVERSEDGPTITLKFVDVGVATAASPPTVGLAAQMVGNTQNGAQVPVTLNASSQQAEVHCAPTSAGTVGAPATSSATWRFVAMTTASATVPAVGLPGGSRVFFRARTNPGAGDALQVPSSWVPAASSGYVDLTSLAAPSNLATTSVQTNQATLTWTPGSTSLLTQVYLTTPSSSAALTLIQTLTPGTARYLVGTLTSGTTYYASINHADPFGGVSASTGLSFQTSSGSYTCAALAGFSVINGLLV